MHIYLQVHNKIWSETRRVTVTKKPNANYIISHFDIFGNKAISTELTSQFILFTTHFVTRNFIE